MGFHQRLLIILSPIHEQISDTIGMNLIMGTPMNGVLFGVALRHYFLELSC